MANRIIKALGCVGLGGVLGLAAAARDGGLASRAEAGAPPTTGAAETPSCCSAGSSTDALRRRAIAAGATPGPAPAECPEAVEPE